MLDWGWRFRLRVFRELGAWGFRVYWFRDVRFRVRVFRGLGARGFRVCWFRDVGFVVQFRGLGQGLDSIT